MEKKSLKTELIGERIILRKHDLSIAQMMFNYVQEDKERLDKFLPWVGFIQTVEDEINYIKLTHKRWDDLTHFDYGIFDKETNTYMGNIGVHSVYWDHACAELGYWILGKFERKGYMTESVTILEKHLFEIGFNRVQIRCSDLNDRSANVPKRCGYTFEGIARENRLEKGKFRNTATYSKLSSD